MTPPSELLSQLRDIHLPPPVAFWPPAPGWWGVAALLVALVGGVLWWRRRQKNMLPTPWLPVALAEVDRLERAFSQHGDGNLLACQLSHVLKQAALTRFDRLRVAPLWGESWLAFLDETVGDTPFTCGAGRPLGEAAFRPHIPVEPQPLLELTRHWLSHVLGENHP